WTREAQEQHRESSQRDSDRLRQSYARYPVRLLGLVVADLFLGDDIRRFAERLEPFLREQPLGSGSGLEVDEFFREALSAVGGAQEWLAPLRFVQEGRPTGLPGGARQVRLPAGVASADLLLSRLPSALVVGATVATLSSDPAALIFGADHQGSVEVGEHNIKFGMVEEAKRTALARALAPAVSTGLLPAELGLLRARRYPRGALVVWSLPELPAEDVEWHDVARVLGIETWNRWDGEGERLLMGVPIEDESR